VSVRIPSSQYAILLNARIDKYEEWCCMTLVELRRDKRNDILSLANRHGASNIRVFGSLARGSATVASDLDLLVDFEPNRSLLDQIALQQDLEALLGCRVDIVEPGGISPYLAQSILSEAVPL
jgi:predicted nucleotidyltransferase